MRPPLPRPAAAVLAALLAAAVLVASAVPARAGAQHDAHHGTSSRRDGRAPAVGRVSFPNSGAPAAQEPFLRGVALLHSFEYEDAAAAFREARVKDPALALAYWLEAFTNSQVLWGHEDLPAARRVLARLGPTPAARLAAARTARERAFGAAFEAFYDGAPLGARTRALADSMRRVAAAYPDDHEAQAFAAIAVMLTGAELPVARRAETNAEAAGYAQRVFDANPQHPGAAHYIIHAWDAPSTAERGLAAARAYDKIAPDADHALHMPSHIFLQLGLWGDVVASNERAWAASRASVARAGRSPADNSWHSLAWLQYAYLQQGRRAAARALVDTARALLAGGFDGTAYPDARFAVADLAFAYAAETGEWTPATLALLGAAPPAAAGPRSAREEGMRRVAAYYGAVAATRGTDSSAAARVAAYAPPSDTAAAGPSFVASNRLQVRALAARARGDRAAALDLLAASAAREAELQFLGPTRRLLSHELLGAALLEAGRPADAARAYERALALCPNRSAALLGLARSRAAAGDRAGAADAYRRLAENWRGADADVPELAEARRGAADAAR
jgi:hypothetical protein